METLVIEHSLVVNAPVERVWRALTDPVRFTNWFGDSVQFDRAAVGETIVFMNMTEEAGKIKVVEPPREFAFTWSAEVGSGKQNLVTFVLEPVDGQTRVTVTETGFEQLPPAVGRSRFESNNEGWAIQLRNIAAHVEAADDDRGE